MDDKMGFRLPLVEGSITVFQTTAEQLGWSKAGFPTLTDVAPLAGDALFRVLRDEQRRQLLHDDSAQTAVERGNGLIPAVWVKTGGQRLPTLQQLADTFDECIGPGGLHAGAATRQPGVQC
jgi:hypothetical protein